MRYYPKSAQGIEMNTSTAEVIGLLEQWEEWDGDQFENDLIYEFEDKYGVTPERLITFEDSKGGEISGLSGFESGTTYLLFDKKESGEEWDAFLDLLGDNQIDIVEGKWSQLG